MGICLNEIEIEFAVVLCLIVFSLSIALVFHHYAQIAHSEIY